MDPDISIWRKTGHFYSALTRAEPMRASSVVNAASIDDSLFARPLENRLTYSYIGIY